MVPAALPARSAPIGDKVDFRAEASWLDTPATACTSASAPMKKIQSKLKIRTDIAPLRASYTGHILTHLFFVNFRVPATVLAMVGSITRRSAVPKGSSRMLRSLSAAFAVAGALAGPSAYG